MTPAQFIAEVVEPTVRDFGANPRSRRQAYLACIATFHVAEHLRRAGERDIEEKLRANGPAFFDAVHGVCNGAKHVSTGRSQRAAFAVGDDVERPAAGFGEGAFGVGRFADPGGRQIDTPEGTVDLYERAVGCSAPTSCTSHIISTGAASTGCDGFGTAYNQIPLRK